MEFRSFASFKMEGLRVTFASSSLTGRAYGVDREIMSTRRMKRPCWTFHLIKKNLSLDSMIMLYILGNDSGN